MKVYIGPYKNWFGPYQLAEKLCFWAKDEKDEYGFAMKPDWVHNFGTWLADNKDGSDTLVSKFLYWIDSFKSRNIKVHIDRWDTWSMDHTLALIISPMLKQLRDRQHGYHLVDPEDVPEKLRLTEHNEWDSQLNLFDNKVCNPENISIGEDQWNWVLNEMIFAFESFENDWEKKYESGEHDIQWKKLENGNSEMVKGPNDTFKCDYVNMEIERERIDNGLRLFGKYYRGLWD